MPARWLKPVTRRDPWWPRDQRDTVVRRVRLLPGSAAKISTLEAANKVFVCVQDTAYSGSATNDTIPPTHSSSPREMLQIIKSGDADTCDTVAALILLTRQLERYVVSGLAVPLRYGLGIQRGDTVRVKMPRAGINAAYPVRRLQHDFSSNITTIDVGEYQAPRTAEDVNVKLALMLAQLEKEAAL